MALSNADVAKYKEKLEKLRAHMTQLIRDTSEDVKSLDETKGYSQHQADEGTDDFNRTISLEVTSKEFDVLRQIERALEKVSDGTYGVCDISGEEIPVARLDAIPYACTTVKAQDKLEKGLL